MKWERQILVGYYTKWGDGASDFLPMGDLYKSQVYALARSLDVPTEILERIPTAELWEGQSDEEELGISYESLDKILYSFCSISKRSFLLFFL